MKRFSLITAESIFCVLAALSGPAGAQTTMPAESSPPVVMTGPATTPAGSPATAPTAAPSKELQAALDGLADDDANVRQNSQDTLVQFGAEAVEPLKKLLTTTTDLEQRTGAQAALARIQEMASTGPTIVTLKMAGVPLEKVIAELSKQSGIPLKSFAGQERKSITIDIDHQPFWVAMKEICKITGLNIMSQGRGNSLGFGRGGTDISGPFAVDGPFMIVATAVSMNSSIQLNQPGNINRNQNIQFMCFAEPKLQLSQRPYNVKLLEAADDTGKSLMMNDQDNMFGGFNADQQPMWQASANLGEPDPKAKKIALLRGQVHLLAATKTETIEIPDLLTAKNVTKTVGAQSLTVKDASVTGDDVSINIVLVAPVTQDNNAYNLVQNIRLLDANGATLQSNGISGGGGANGKLEYRLRFNKRTFDDGEKHLGDPAKLVLPIATETKPIECNFEFKNLPLP